MEVQALRHLSSAYHGSAIICPGVRIGARSVIGAGSVVTRTIPDGVFAVGNPCRVVRGIGECAQTGRLPQGPA